LKNGAGEANLGFDGMENQGCWKKKGRTHGIAS